LIIEEMPVCKHYKAVDGRSISFAEAAWFITLPEGVAAH